MVEGYDYLKQQQVTITAHGLEAIVFQHEQGHLEGKLYYDLINKTGPWMKKVIELLYKNNINFFKMQTVIWNATNQLRKELIFLMEKNIILFCGP
ncbi:MAG: peptide deformylase [Spiroplasma phoeniceum]|nr:MAG: peptide deformylase [Spiroplasma phoeniceum]UZQ33641.1 MAG: peptide deformylase [Spiroplasma phoeniceum]